MIDKQATLEKVLEIRRVINEQYISLLQLDTLSTQDEKDIETLKGMLTGARGVLESFAERTIKSIKEFGQL